MRKWFLRLVCLTVVCRLQAQGEQDPATAILQLFEQHPIVMFGEVHGCVQEDALLKKLVTSPEFAARVNDVVIEMGNSLYQEILDRYIAGENVPIEQLRKTWENQVGAPGGNPTPPYHGLLAAVREANQRLPKGRHLRVLAGDPPIEWEDVESRQARIRLIAPLPDDDGQYTVRLSLPNPTRARLAGQVAHVRLAIPARREER